jgi:hypothetical protein
LQGCARAERKPRSGRRLKGFKSRCSRLGAGKVHRGVGRNRRDSLLRAMRQSRTRSSARRSVPRSPIIKLVEAERSLSMEADYWMSSLALGAARLA